MRRFLALVPLACICACAGLPKPPPGLETDRSFTTVSAVSYQDAYRSVARRSTACFAQGGLSSINYSIQADLDAAAMVGRVELFPVGLLSAENKDSDRKSYVTTVAAKGEGSEVTTTGPSRSGAFTVHSINMQWVAGEASCTLQR